MWLNYLSPAAYNAMSAIIFALALWIFIKRDKADDGGLGDYTNG